MADKIALIDLDGTTADYDSAMDAELAKLASPLEEFEWRHAREPRLRRDAAAPHIRAREDLIRRQPGFWQNLPRLKAGFEVVEDLESIGFKLHVLTKGPMSATSAWTEKVEWCREHLPRAAITITQDKALVFGRVLVDDWPPFASRWLEVRPRGLVICVAHPWNADFNHPQVFRYNGANREEMRERISASFHRI